MKIKTGYIFDIIKDKHKFSIIRKYPNLPLVTGEGSRLKKGEVFAKGKDSKVLFEINLKDLFKKNNIRGLLRVIDGEVVLEGQLLAEGKVQGRKYKKVKSPTDGIIRIDSDRICVLRGSCTKQESVPIDSVFENATRDSIEISSNSISFRYNFLVGETKDCGKYSKPIFLLPVSDRLVRNLRGDGYDPKSLAGSVLVLRKNLLTQVYKDAVGYGINAIICGGLRYSDYVELTDIATIPILVINSWGVSMINDKIFKYLENDKLIDVDFNRKEIFINIEGSKNHDLENLLLRSELVYLERNMQVLVHGYPYESKEGRIVEKLDDDEVLVELKSEKRVVCDYRNIEVIGN